eukprot:TRINITY_DN5946_c0_g1_i1.p1 TRINITY_DN5946_c0_g1~~TRINITY_DN5946_c0_g1_i1.p1  ORF type:complete len:381 (-),score=41.71 TRINITY_DN5946_c0_g1_i1:94-1236(-)
MKDIQLKRRYKRSSIGGFLAIQTFLIVLYSVNFTITTYKEPRLTQMDPYTQTSLAHLQYVNQPQDINVHVIAYINECNASKKSCLQDLDLQSNSGMHNISCKIENEACIVSWISNPTKIYDPGNGTFNPYARQEFSFKTSGTSVTYLIFSPIVYNSNWARQDTQENSKKLMEWSLNHWKKTNETVHASIHQCFTTKHDAGFNGLYRRIHFPPIAYNKDTKKPYRDITSQALYFLEMDYPSANAQKGRSVLDIWVALDPTSWFLDRQSTTYLVIQIFLIIAAGVAMPPFLRKVVDTVTQSLTVGICGDVLAFIIIVVVLCAMTVTAVSFQLTLKSSSSATMFNVTLAFVLYCSTLTIALVIRLIWMKWIKAKYRQLLHENI